VVVDRRRRQPLLVQVTLPGHDIARDAGREAVMAIGLDEEGAEPLQMQSDFPGHRFGTDTGHRQLQVAVDPGRQAVGDTFGHWLHLS